ncbi:MAG: hypothetical protein EXS38_09860 [Opitutus sp.]|nr:hypothetical protein [Opitutus sp.]
MTTPVIKCWLLSLTMAVAGLVGPAVAADESPKVDPKVAEMVVVDADLARFERLLKHYDNPRDQGYVGEIFGVLKERVEVLRKDFDQLKADDLRFDINTQAQRLALAMAPLVTPLPTKDLSLDLEELNPNPAKKAEVTAALAALDGAIARQEKQAKTLTQGREAALARVENLKKMRAALASKFTPAGWLAAVKELKRP